MHVSAIYRLEIQISSPESLGRYTHHTTIHIHVQLTCAACTGVGVD